MKNSFRISSKRLLISSLLGLGLISASASAQDLTPGKAYPPYHVKPGTNRLLPSGLSPQQVIKAYGFDQITSQGEGQVIGLVDAYDDPNIEQDLGVFSNAFGLPECTTANGCFTKVYASGTQPAPNTGWSGEISLDVEWAHAIAPKAKIILVEAASDSTSDLYTAIQVAVQKGANVVSMSWGGPESSEDPSSDKMFQVNGVTFTASAGDSGHGLIYPATSPYVISVGGTTLNVDASGSVVSEKAWSGSGGGLSKYESVPDYQSNYPIPKDPKKKRGVPDVSYNANPNTGFSVYDSVGGTGWMVVGGTSAGAPQWAALIAIANSAANTSLSNTNSLLYAAATANYSGNFNDIIAGKNGGCGYYCKARAGYDYVTGLGSPQAANLVGAITK